MEEDQSGLMMKGGTRWGQVQLRGSVYTPGIGSILKHNHKRISNGTLKLLFLEAKADVLMACFID